MNFKIVKEFDDMIILMTKSPEDDYYEYYISNPWFTIIHHWIGVKEPITNRELTIEYYSHEFDRFRNKYCF